METKGGPENQREQNQKDIPRKPLGGTYHDVPKWHRFVLHGQGPLFRIKDKNFRDHRYF